MVLSPIKLCFLLIMLVDPNGKGPTDPPGSGFYSNPLYMINDGLRIRMDQFFSLFTFNFNVYGKREIPRDQKSISYGLRAISFFSGSVFENSFYIHTYACKK